MAEEALSVPKTHNLTGVYFRYRNPITGQMENRTFEDLPEEVQRLQMEGRSEEWLKEMVIILAKCLHHISDEFDINAAEEENPSTFN